MAWTEVDDSRIEDRVGKYHRKIYTFTPDGAIEDLNDLDATWGYIHSARAIGDTANSGAQALIDYDDPTNAILCGAAGTLGYVKVEIIGELTA